jgi:hypothetical protein
VRAENGGVALFTFSFFGLSLVSKDELSCYEASGTAAFTFTFAWNLI